MSRRVHEPRKIGARPRRPRRTCALAALYVAGAAAHALGPIYPADQPPAYRLAAALAAVAAWLAAAAIRAPIDDAT